MIRRRLSLLASLLAALVFSIGLPRRSAAVSPDSPEVKQMIERALKSLESQDDDRLGGRCLVGLSFYKAGRKADHPKVVAARQACESAFGADIKSQDNYSVGLALVFLLETDPERNHSLARRYVDEVLRRQQRWGSWGYPESQTGDTSQTQYPTLGLWLAANNGIEVPLSAFERDCGWLLRTQDPSGGWGYQGNDPGRYQRVAQTDVKPALAAAGLCSMYICGDILGANEAKPSADKPTTPTALRPIGDPLQTRGRSFTSGIDPKLIRQAISDGNYWFSKHYAIESEGHTHYYLYAFERYQSFREFAERRSDSNPRWYNDVYSYLRRTQDAEGFWAGTDGQAVCTSFAVLTLLRSTKKTLAAVATAAKLGEGVLVGGLGLPKNTADLQERGGKIIESPLGGTIDELLATIEKGDKSELEILAQTPARWKLDNDVTKRSGEIARLRSVVSSGPFESRLVGVKALAQVRDLDHVPLLIYALSDPDMRIVREADKGLRFVSRKFEGIGISEEPTQLEAKNGIAAWKAWYQSIRPNAEFLD